MTNADVPRHEALHYSFELPRRASERGESSDLVRVEGVVGPEIAAVRGPPGSTLGVHAVNLGERKSLCKCDVRDYEGASNPREVTCRFCQARLVAIGLLGADEPQVDPYARLYGGRARGVVEMDTQRAGEYRARSRFFGVEAEGRKPAEYLRELDILRTGSESAVMDYLEQHFHSDRFYVDGDRIWLELPNRIEKEPDRAVLVWYRIPAEITIAGPVAGSRSGTHAIPSGWDATLCLLSTSAWTSGIRDASQAMVECRLCWIRLLAAEIVRGVPVPVTSPN